MLTKAVYADTEGFVSEMDTRALGMAVVAMGGGRRQASDTIDYSVGFTDMARLGDRVDGQRPLAVIHAKDENSWQEAAKAVKAVLNEVGYLFVPLPYDQRLLPALPLSSTACNFLRASASSFASLPEISISTHSAIVTSNRRGYDTTRQELHRFTNFNRVTCTGGQYLILYR